MLRSSDVNFEAKTLRWRSEHDKIGFEHVTPLRDKAVAVLERLRKAQGTIGEAWLFPSPEDGTKPLHRRTLSKWWKTTETLARLVEVKGRGLHSLRRKFATEMKDTPLRDLAHLGGWKCTNTVVMVYQQPDDETMRAALSRRTTLKSCDGDEVNGHNERAQSTTPPRFRSGARTRKSLLRKRIG